MGRVELTETPEGVFEFSNAYHAVTVLVEHFERLHVLVFGKIFEPRVRHQGQEFIKVNCARVVGIDGFDNGLDLDLQKRIITQNPPHEGLQFQGCDGAVPI